MEAPLIFLVIKNNCFNCIKLEVVFFFQSLCRRPTKETATETAPLIQNTINVRVMPGVHGPEPRVSAEHHLNGESGEQIKSPLQPHHRHRCTHARCDVSRGIIG